MMQEYVLRELDSKIPREEVSTRSGGNGVTLDYVSGYYVISQLNRIFGPANWSYTSEVSKLFEGRVLDRYGKDIFTVHYSSCVKLRVKFPNSQTTEFSDYGYGDGTDKTNPGKAHELAIKEAVTDGIKRCAKNLGNRLGLALYSKEQENVEETSTLPENAQEPSDPPAEMKTKEKDTQGTQQKASLKVKSITPFDKKPSPTKQQSQAAQIPGDEL